MWSRLAIRVNSFCVVTDLSVSLQMTGPVSGGDGTGVCDLDSSSGLDRDMPENIKKLHQLALQYVGQVGIVGQVGTVGQVVIVGQVGIVGQGDSGSGFQVMYIPEFF